MTYSTDTNILGRISHIKTASGVSVSEYRESAYTKININIRKLYTVPIVSSEQTDMDFLRDTEADLAGGTLILNVASVHKLEGLSEFGQFLIDNATANLDKLISEDIILVGAEEDTDSNDNMINFPVIEFNSPDSYSNFNKKQSEIDEDISEGLVNTRE